MTDEEKIIIPCSYCKFFNLKLRVCTNEAAAECLYFELLEKELKNESNITD